MTDSAASTMSAMWDNNDPAPPTPNKETPVQPTPSQPRKRPVKKAAAPVPSVKAKPSQPRKRPVKKAASMAPADREAKYVKATNYNGIRGAKVETFGIASKSAMLRVAAEFHAAVLKRAKRDGQTIVEVTRSLASKV